MSDQLLALIEQHERDTKAHNSLRDTINAKRLSYFAKLDEIHVEVPELAGLKDDFEAGERVLEDKNHSLKKLEISIKSISKDMDDLGDFRPVLSTRTNNLAIAHFDQVAALQWVKARREGANVWSLVEPIKKAFVEAKVNGAPIPDDVLRLTTKTQVVLYASKITTWLKKRKEAEHEQNEPAS